MDKVRAHIFISGRVQGVFYRDWAREEASSLGLRGWVRNLRDGRVEAVFEGFKEDIQEIISQCSEGSRAANVDNIDIKWEKATDELEGFEIKPTT
jgi:acylphosphatase